MRAVIENGNNFKKSDFFLMLREFLPEHIDEHLIKYLKVIIEELGVTQFDFEDFLHEIKEQI